MRRLPQRSIEYVERLPKAAPLCPGAVLHPGERAAVDQALSRLARSDKPMRIGNAQTLRQGEAGEPRHHATAGRRLSASGGGRLVAARCGQAGAAPVDPAGMNADHRGGSNIPVGFFDTGGDGVCYDVGQVFLSCLSARDGCGRSFRGVVADRLWAISRER